MIRQLLTLACFSFFGFLSAVLAQAPENITIGALPGFSTCQPALISWSGGRSPYRVYIYPADWVNQTDWIVELPLTTRTQTTWNVNLDAGSGIVVNVWDGINDAYSEPAWIQDSGDSTCLGSNGRIQSSALNSTDSTSSTTSLSGQSSSGPIVVSTPSSSPPARSSTPLPPISSQNAPPSSASSAPVPPATVTVSPSGALPQLGHVQSMIRAGLLLCLIALVGI